MDLKVPIRVAIIDDQQLFLEGLAMLLDTVRDKVVVSWVSSLHGDALQKAAAMPPDIFILDYFFKIGSPTGGQLCKEILSILPEAKVIILTVSLDPKVIKEVFANGAKGYLSKDVSKAEILEAIEAVASGEEYIDRQVTKVMIDSFKETTSKSILTKREIEVALLYVQDITGVNIAKQLYISLDTVESHIKHIRAKAGASTRSELREWLKINGYL